MRFFIAPLLFALCGALCDKPAIVVDAGVVALPPPPDPNAQRLNDLIDKAAKGFVCPDGTTKLGEEPPDGKEVWCEKSGKRHGPYRAWHDNGLKALDGGYKDGKRDGLWVEWHQNGERKSEVTYVDDKPHGRYRIWAENGDVLSDVTYDRGKVR
jgi:hypothetical protein